MQGHDLKKLINKVMKETGQTAREGKLHPLKRQGEGAENYKEEEKITRLRRWRFSLKRR